MMDENAFWNIISSSREQAGGKQDAQCDALTVLLLALSIEDIESFEGHFSTLMARSYRWELWAAAYLVLGGCSDDCFSYFRYWLISMGREHFEAALANPDNLADIDLPPDDEEAFAEWQQRVKDPEVFPEFEDFGYVAAQVWAKKTGKEYCEMPSSPILNATYSKGPAGSTWDETDTAYFIQTFPRLWEKFGW